VKTFLWTFVAVFVGIYAFTKLSAKKVAASQAMSGTAPIDSLGVYAGPEIDPKTGAFLPPGSGAGTVSFASSPSMSDATSIGAKY